MPLNTLYDSFNVINLIQFTRAFHTFKPSPWRHQNRPKPEGRGPGLTCPVARGATRCGCVP